MTLVKKTGLGVLGGVLLALAAGPVAASPCADAIGAVEARFASAATTAGAASSGGQAVAAAREGKAVEAREENRMPTTPAVPFQAPAQETEATQRAAKAATAGDGAIRAKATLNRARTLDGKGDATGCMAAVEEARRELSAGP